MKIARLKKQSTYMYKRESNSLAWLSQVEVKILAKGSETSGILNKRLEIMDSLHLVSMKQRFLHSSSL